MFRRRPRNRLPLRRRLQRLSPFSRRAPSLPGELHRALVRANRLMAEGQPTEAAGIYARLYEKEKERGFVVRAADLALQAARACFQVGDIDTARRHSKEALRLFAQGGRFGRILRVSSKMGAALRERGYTAEADLMEQDVERILVDNGLSFEEAKQQALQAPEQRGTLPAKCSGCGAFVVSDEVEWHDAQTAECLYCGAVLKTS